MASNVDETKLTDSEDSSVSVGRLYQEMVGGLGADGDAVEQRAEIVLETVLDALFDDEFEFNEATVKANLNEILLMLVALRDSQTHGKGLMEDLERVFGADLSPGTVYPRLHELEEEGVLEVQELVRTKEYRIDDPAQSREHVEAAMRQHLALGFFFKAALDEL
ncbi:helix-turn-helix transcriptional regulator [Halorarius litoreus]|uniref:helix-turn-helix transcriptional regulator n=1 Tax=Halorarius litoreus TaxID=2962676 RepID=UPI0020CBF75C|nr:helix-turn-helix transcriptional regulator [Halorarius litoreus]